MEERMTEGRVASPSPQREGRALVQGVDTTRKKGKNRDVHETM